MHRDCALADTPKACWAQLLNGHGTITLAVFAMVRFLGAKVVLTPAPASGTGMVQKATELADAHGWFLTRQFENEANADIHSRTTAKEIVDDFAGERLDYFVTGFGTSGTLKALAVC